MKKSILSLFILGLSFVGFSSATTINCVGSVEAGERPSTCTPYGYNSPFVATENTVVKITSFGTCTYNSERDLEDVIAGDGNGGDWIGYDDLIDGYSMSEGDEFSFMFYPASEEEEGQDVSNYTCSFNVSGLPGDSQGGNDSGNFGGSLLPGGIDSLSGITSGLSNTINEFIPYLVYLGLGIITAIVGFVAIKWLINRVSSKVRGTFRSGKRKR